MHPTYPVMLVTEFEIYVNVLLFSADWFFCFISFIFRHLEARATHEINTGWWIILLAPYFHGIIPVVFFLWGCLNDSVFRNSVDGTATLHGGVWWKTYWPIHGHNWPVSFTSSGPLGVRLMTWTEVHMTLFEWQNGLQKSSNFCLFWLSCNKSLKKY